MVMSRREMIQALAAGALLPELLGRTKNVWGQAGSTGRALALTIGLNAVDPRFYGGWAGILQGCEADADRDKSTQQHWQAQGPSCQ